MKRIPVPDMFGVPRSLGLPLQIQEPQAPAPSGPVTLPAPPEVQPRLETALRFEILDAEGNYIPGVAVSLVTADGTHLITPGLSDIGGNVAVSTRDLYAAAEEAVRKNPNIQKQAIFAAIEGPDYEPVKIPLFDPSKGQRIEDVKRLHEVTLQKASGGINPVVAIAGAAAAIGLIYLLAKG